GLQVEGTLDNTAQVAAGILQEGFQDVDGGPYHKHEQQQGHRQHHIQDRQSFYPFVHTRYHRHGRRRGNHRNGYNLHRGADRDTFPQVVDTRVNLGNRQAQGGGNTEHRTEDGKHIHGMADGAVDFLANQRIQGRADGQGQTVTESKISQYQPHQAINRPDMETPVEKSNLHGLFGGIHRFGRAGRWRGVM